MLSLDLLALEENIDGNEKRNLYKKIREA